jgi:hypothetical protein
MRLSVLLSLLLGSALAAADGAAPPSCAACDTCGTKAAVAEASASAAAVRPYPLAECLVSGEKLGSMGKPVVFVLEGREIKLCCKGCERDFRKNSARYLATLDAAAAAATAAQVR